MNRRDFIERITMGSVAMGSLPLLSFSNNIFEKSVRMKSLTDELSADVVIAGGGLGGLAAAMGSLRNGLSVILTEETDWVGGQLTQQGVPPDEHRWIETHGAPKLYRNFRDAVREYYKRNYPLTEKTRDHQHLNPGDGAVSRLCHEPRVALAVLLNMLAPYLSSRKLTLLLENKIVAADVSGDQVRYLQSKSIRSGKKVTLNAPYFVDATELGELLPLTGTEYVSGAESRKETGELHAADEADPTNNQAYTHCFSMDYIPGENHVIPKPSEYDFWRNFEPEMEPPWPGKLLELNYPNPSTLEPKRLGFHPEGDKTGDALNLWLYRRIINPENFKPGTYQGGITLVNWPQHDYFLGNIIDVSDEEFEKHINRGKQLSLSLLYWLQTEAPRPDGGKGWPGLRLRNDIMGTEDGLAKYPYVRESRRIKAEFTILEEHVGAENRAMVTGKESVDKAADFYDSVGIGYYHIDLHPSSGGDNYIDFGSLPFQIPMGALLPKRIKNLLPANKNIGTTHITNGCYRLHPVEWSIGEAVGVLVTYAKKKGVIPRAIRENENMLNEFQKLIRSQGIETHWPDR
ncbi:MAG: FAD-dependent oxidoreductase [Bacteroidota bacterium]